MRGAGCQGGGSAPSVRRADSPIHYTQDTARTVSCAPDLEHLHGGAAVYGRAMKRPPAAGACATASLDYVAAYGIYTSDSMDPRVEKLLHCVPVKVLAKCRDPGYALLEKRERPVAVVFADIEDCTKLCEDLPPAAMNELIEAHFSRFFDAVETAGGTVNEIMGDGFMAIFDDADAGDLARAAASAALTIQRQNRELNEKRPPELDPLLVNIGIHAGTGLVGFTKFRTTSGERWTYTASGPVTNVASRLCALATGGSILVSEEVVRHLQPARHVLEFLGPQRLKNVSRPVPAFRLLAADVDATPPIAAR